jgi:membrane protease YdiL (CAAX protease family)
MPDSLAESFSPQPIPPPPDALPPKRGVAWLAWLVILLVVGFEVFGLRLVQRLRPSLPRPAEKDRLDLLVNELQVRNIVGAAELTGSRKAMFAQARSLNTGPIDQRLPFIVLAGDLDGPGEALAQIAQIDKDLAEQGLKPDEDQQAVLDALTRLYRDRQDGTKTLTDADRDLLRRRLGWAGELALTPPDDPDQTAARQRVVQPAKRLATTFLVVFAVGGVVGLSGLVGLVILAVFFFLGKLPPALARPTRHGGIYAEAFAVYMVVFLALGIGHRLLKVPGPELLLQAAGMLLSLAAGLIWPVLRGIPWRQVRQEVGLTLGRHPWLEPLIGLGGYALVLPTFAVGIIISSVLIQYERHVRVGDRPEQYFAPVDQPSHPIMEWLQDPDWSLLAQVVLVACVLAPLVEETMFRGALYRHLRNATARLGRAGSFLISALIVSFVFAVIHPQGILAVPALMALAFGLNILREWRGSLLPSMMVHGIHNGLTTFILVQALRS